jgi:hypothetical protein
MGRKAQALRKRTLADCTQYRGSAPTSLHPWVSRARLAIAACMARNVIPGVRPPAALLRARRARWRSNAGGSSTRYFTTHQRGGGGRHEPRAWGGNRRRPETPRATRQSGAAARHDALERHVGAPGLMENPVAHLSCLHASPSLPRVWPTTQVDVVILAPAFHRRC